MNILDVLNEIWNQILAVTSIFVMPDWGGLIGALPVIILLGVVMPFLTFLALGMMIYTIRKPRTKVDLRGRPAGRRDRPRRRPDLPGRPAPLPSRHAWSTRPGTVRCERCRDELAVICPMCSLGRPAIIDTCTNCGLVLKVNPRAVAVRTTSGPRPGGAAAA